MKTLAIAVALFGLATMTAMGQQSTGANTSRSNVRNNIPVLGPDGKVWCAPSASAKAVPCTASDVVQLNAALAKSIDFSKGKSKTTVTSIALAKDGSLMCTTGSGPVPCASKHVSDLNEAARAVSQKGISGK